MRILGLNPLDQLALFRVSRNNRIRTMRALPQRPFGKVEAKIRLSHFWIWTMTTETAAREDRLHVLIKVQTARSSATTTDQGAQHDGRQK